MQYAVPELFSAPQVGHEDTERARLDSEELAHISLESDVFVLILYTLVCSFSHLMSVLFVGFLAVPLSVVGLFGISV